MSPTALAHRDTEAPRRDTQEPAGDASLDPAAKEGTQIGKRYVDEGGTLELLCTKPGEGSLALGDQLLSLKEAKPLPSSD